MVVVDGGWSKKKFFNFAETLLSKTERKEKKRKEREKKRKRKERKKDPHR